MPTMMSKLLAPRVLTSAIRPRARLPALGCTRFKSALAGDTVQSHATNTFSKATPKKATLMAQIFDTKDRAVVLPADGDLTRGGPGGLNKMRMTQLNDGQPRTAAQLEVVRQDFLNEFHATYSLFEKMHGMFNNASAFYRKHEQLRHPPIFYVGHTASFYINKLILGKFITERIDPVLEMQTAVGVDEMSWDDLDTNKYAWPSFEEAETDPVAATQFLQKVLDYRREVRNVVEQLIKDTPMEWPIKKDSFWWVIAMGIEHERIHLETSSVILRQAPMNFMQQINELPRCVEGRFHPDPNSAEAKGTPENSLIPIEAGATRLGRSWEGTKTYGWDNEFGKEQMFDVPAFAASEYLVSNKEYLEFVNAGGYSTERYWTEEGWSWVSDMKPEQPRFWRKQGGDYYLRLMYEEVAMAWDWPVECNHHESAAFCKYLSEKKGQTIRLPCEDEYMRLRDAEPTDIQHSAHGPAWTVAPGNVNMEHFASPCPVNKFRSPSGLCDVLGNVWQHSASPLDILDGFASHPLYEDFTTPTVDNFHSRIMGGSWISTGANGGSRDSRYGFRKHFYQHAGFRYVQSERDVVLSVSPYEVRQHLCHAYRFHFDKPAFGRNYPEALAEAAVDALKKLGRSPEATSAMELGCGPGRTVLELAKRGLFWVNGADMTAKSFNATSNQLLASGKMRWHNYLEGEFVDKRQCTLEELDIPNAKQLSVAWHQVPDFTACDNKKFHSYDLVICAQPGALKQSDPEGVLKTVHTLVRPGGLLMIGTQYDWEPKQTSADDTLSALLSKWFDPVLEPQDLDFVKAETSRKFECGKQHLTFWTRREEPRASEASKAEQQAAAAKDANITAYEATGQGMYDQDVVLGQYLEFHYGPKSEYPAECAQRCLQVMKEVGQPMGKALEVGGGPGRSAVELSKEFKEVHSGDYSTTFVEAGQKLLNGGELNWSVLEDRTSGKMVERSVNAEELGAGNVSFSQVDAHNLPDDKFDLICGFNLIDRLEKPAVFLQSIKSRLNDGGVLVLSSPYTWLEEFTPKDNWLGGFKYGDNDGPSTYEGMKELLLADGFEEVKAPEDVWFRIDSLANGRVSQQTRAQMTYWRRK